MRTRFFYPAVFCVFLAHGAVAQEGEVGGELTLEMVFEEGAGGRQAEQVMWAPEGGRLSYVWEDDAGKGLWLLDAASGKSELLLRASGEGMEEGFEFDEVVWSPRGDALLVVSDGDLYLFGLAGRKLERLTKTEEDEEEPAFSPDGGRVAFVRDFDLWVLDLERREERALTADGEENQVLNGTTDWVYWEEIWGRDATGFWWSPEGKRIAYYRFEEAGVAEYPLVDELPKYPRVKMQKYPKAGETNPRVKVGVLDLAGGATTWLSTGGAEEDYLARVHWAPGGERLAVEHLNRDQTRLALLFCGAGDGRCTPVHAQEWPTWVELENDFRFLPDGRFVWGAEHEGYRRLYLHAANGGRLRAVTPEGFTVTALEAVEEAEGAVVVSGFLAGPSGAAERQVVRAWIEGGPADVLTPGAGWHGATVAPGGAHWVHSSSDANTPQRRVVRRRDGSEVAALPSTPPLFDLAAAPRWEPLTIPGPESSRLPARILKPAGFDPARRWPVIMYHYGGPASQVVVDRWEGTTRGLWHRAMAGRGYAVLSVDNQASLFFSRAGKDRLHRRFGELELAGQLAGVDYLKTLGWADPARIGLWGWSGGGANTLYSVLNRPGVWKAAVAGAPVTDWTLYDSVWTERYLDHPRDNPEGYVASSPVTHAAKLADPLLLVHGTGDDNVHPQNSVVMSQKLIEAGRPFEQAFYPNQKHGLRRAAERHFYLRMTDFFDRHLGGAAPTPPPADPARAGTGAAGRSPRTGSAGSARAGTAARRPASPGGR